MYKQFAGSFADAIDGAELASSVLGQSGLLDGFGPLERIGSRRRFARDNEIYAEGDQSDCWYKIIAGTVRTTKLLADGRRHIAEFYSCGDCFGLDHASERPSSAEAVGDVVVMQYPRGATDRLVEHDLRLARHFCHVTLGELAHAQTRMLLLGRMTAPERVASFLLEMAGRCDGKRLIDLPMSRTDIADYLGLTIETVCRVLSGFKRDGLIAIPNAHQIELRDREALEAVCET